MVTELSRPQRVSHGITQRWWLEKLFPHRSRHQNSSRSARDDRRFPFAAAAAAFFSTSNLSHRF